MPEGIDYRDLCTCEPHTSKTAPNYEVHEVGCGRNLTKHQFLGMKRQIEELKKENARLAALYKDHQENCTIIRYKTASKL